MLLPKKILYVTKLKKKVGKTTKCKKRKKKGFSEINLKIQES